MKAVKGKSRWGMGIAALYLSFVVFILACVGFATLQNYDLVEKDYYDKGVAYQGEIDRFTRTERLPSKPAAAYNKGSKTIVLLFPSQLTDSTITGSYQMMRPSNATLDTTFTLAVDKNGVQVIDATSLTKGLWRTSLVWSGGGIEYAVEAMIVVE